MKGWSRIPSVAGSVAVVVVLVGFGGGDAKGRASQPISLHPDNPNYFLYQGRPTVLLASGEHYGALVNLDFDYVRYFDTLRRHGFNVTRVFTGTYVEPEISTTLGHENTLAPRPGRYVAPWARSSTPGYSEGGNRFDLSRWDARYFSRLKDLLRAASRRGIVVELTLFSSYYSDRIWQSSPLHVSGNVNGVGGRSWGQVYEVRDNARLLAVQEALVRKLVREVRPFDNVIFEILNEPWAGHCNSLAPDCSMRHWHDRIISTIWKAEQGSQRRHLISEDVGHGANAVHGAANVALERPNPRVSVYQYHYSSGAAAASNLHLGRAVGNNETGIRGFDERIYRTEGWRFMLAGGALFNNLDWAFTTADPRGRSDEFRSAFADAPGSASPGGPVLQRQLAFLKRTMVSLPFVRMRANRGFVAGGLPAGIRASVLAEAGKTYAVYVPSGPVQELRLRLPSGDFRVTWLDPVTGRTLRTDRVRHRAGLRALRAPAFAEDLALTIRRTA